MEKGNDAGDENGEDDLGECKGQASFRHTVIPKIRFQSMSMSSFQSLLTTGSATVKIETVHSVSIGLQIMVCCFRGATVTVS